jgi:hypothetical protein
MPDLPKLYLSAIGELLGHHFTSNKCRYVFLDFSEQVVPRNGRNHTSARKRPQKNPTGVVNSAPKPFSSLLIAK